MVLSQESFWFYACTMGVLIRSIAIRIRGFHSYLDPGAALLFEEDIFWLHVAVDDFISEE